MLELLIGQIPEAIYFALFMIFVKGLKEKRLIFTILMVLEYVLLLYAMPFSIYAHVGFFVVTYILLKILYKEKAQIIDVFTLGIASVILIAFSIVFSIPKLLFPIDYIYCVVCCRIALFLMLILLNNRLNVIQKVYKKLWNRNDKVEKKIKTTTFRSINLVLFNILFMASNQQEKNMLMKVAQTEKEHYKAMKEMLGNHM
jgi:hypothetical protein